jgi:putative ABC transport system permease protein
VEIVSSAVRRVAIFRNPALPRILKVSSDGDKRFIMFTFALRNLVSRPARSLLSLVGLTVAIMGMVGLFSVAAGLNEMVTDTFGRITGLVAMQPGAPIPLFSRLPASWGTEIAKVPGVASVNPEVWMRANIIDDQLIINPPRFMFGIDIPGRLKLKHSVYRDDMVEGRFLTPADEGTMNAVIGRSIAEQFHKKVGDTIRINGFDMKIVGMYYCGSLLLDVAIILDINEVRRITRFGNDAVCAFYIEQDGKVSDAALSKRIQDVFKGREIAPWQPSSTREAMSTGNVCFDLLARLVETVGTMTRSLVPSGESGKHSHGSNLSAGIGLGGSKLLLPIEVRNATDWAARFEQFSADLDIFLTVLSGIGVTIAVLSIVNTMLMSVTERIIEFGILKANGWTRYDVLRLITSESAVIGFCGGVLGCLVGWAATGVINSIWHERIHLVATPGLLLFGLAFSTALGVVGGLYPALWAMRLMPMDAIRRG